MKLPGFYHYWTKPWKECEMCCLGLTLLYVGDDFRVGLGLLFFEVGVRFKDIVRDSQGNRYERCALCQSLRKIVHGDVVEKCYYCGDEEYRICRDCGHILRKNEAVCPNQDCPLHYDDLGPPPIKKDPPGFERGGK